MISIRDNITLAFTKLRTRRIGSHNFIMAGVIMSILVQFTSLRSHFEHLSLPKRASLTAS
jgi:hypothetical protein